MLVLPRLAMRCVQSHSRTLRLLQSPPCLSRSWGHAVNAGCVHAGAFPGTTRSLCPTSSCWAAGGHSDMPLTTQLDLNRGLISRTPVRVSTRAGGAAGRGAWEQREGEASARRTPGTAQALMRLRRSAVSCWCSAAGGYSGMPLSLSSAKRALARSASAARSSARVASTSANVPQRTCTRSAMSVPWNRLSAGKPAGARGGRIG